MPADIQVHSIFLVVFNTMAPLFFMLMFKIVFKRVCSIYCSFQFAERALGHHLLDNNGGPSAEYYISLARLKLQKHLLDEAEENLKEALQVDHQVSPFIRGIWKFS